LGLYFLNLGHLLIIIYCVVLTEPEPLRGKNAMKKLSVFAVAIGLIFFSASPLLAGGLINKNNLSAEYIRTINRAAATDSADSVAYNPAGTVALEDGMYTNFSIQYFDKEYENITGGTTYSSTEPTTVPAFYAVYKKNKWAGFFGFNIPVGGGKVDYPRGNALTIKLTNALIAYRYPGQGYQSQSMNMNGESYGLGYTFGGAYRINDMFSVSVGARFIDARNELQGSTTIASSNPVPDRTAIIDLEYTARGWGGIIGLDIFVNKNLTIGLKYETKTSLEYTYDVKPATNDDGTFLLGLFGLTNGTEAHDDLPALFSLGVSYKITPALRVEPTLTYYFNENADIGGAFSHTKKLEDRIANGYEVGIAVEYAFTENLKTSAGILWTDTGADADDMKAWLPELNAFSMCTGVAWKAKPNLEVNIGIGWVFYRTDRTSSGAFYPNTEFSKDITQMAFGVQYKFF
jgi:long-chain fatty acid transport protein